MQRWRRWLIAGLSMLAGLSMVSGGAAPAALAAPGDTAWLYSGVYYLPGNPPDSPPKCVSRRIDLGAGTYRWAAGHTTGLDTGRLLIDRTWRLGAGGYTWTVCIDPNAGATPGDGHYVLYTELDPSYGPWRTVRLVSRGFKLTPNEYQIYSFLDPIRLER